MPINDWIVDREQTKRIMAIFRPRRGLETKLLQAIDSAEKRNPCVGYLVVDVPSTFLETTKRRYFNPVGIPFTHCLLENPERMELYDAIKLTKQGAHFLTIRRYTEERPDVLEITLVDPLNKNNVFRRKTKKTKITNSEIFKETIPIVNQYVCRIFRALDKKGLVRYT